MKIYVGNLSLEASVHDLEVAFAKYGSVLSARVAADSKTGRPRGFGFVEMSNRSEAASAIEGINGTHLRGKRLTVNASLDAADQRDWPFDVNRRSRQMVPRT